MMTRIATNLNKRSEAYANAAPRLQAGLDNISREHGAGFTVKLRIYTDLSHACVDVRYKSGALLRDVVAYLDEMQVLD